MFDLASIFKGGTEGVFSGVASVVKTVKADPTEVIKLETAIAQAKAQTDLLLAQAQTKINEIEAGSNSLFVAGWRPAVGWVCVAGLMYEYIVRPLAQSIVVFWHPSYVMVGLESGEIMGLLSGILGLGAYRTYEKAKANIPVV